MKSQLFNNRLPAVFTTLFATRTAMTFKDKLTMTKRIIYVAMLLLIALNGFAQHEKSVRGHENNPWYSTTDTTRVLVSNTEWKKVLSPDLYAVAREKDTER